MPVAGFEPTNPVFKRAKTVHALDRAATVTGSHHIYTFSYYTDPIGITYIQHVFLIYDLITDTQSQSISTTFMFSHTAFFDKFI
jgi:hypothetical protein